MRAMVLWLLAATSAGASVGCSGRPPAAPPVGEGRLAVEGGTIWYRVSGISEGVPIFLLHGGPGLSSFYMRPLEALGDEWPIVRYDQLGGGKSDRISDTALFTIAHFVGELDSLRAHLGFERIHLLGHSWGTILAVEYYRAHAEHVASLILGSAALDIPTWERNARRLVRTLPESAQRAITVREAAQQYDAPDYQAALNEFYGRYVWRHPVAVDLDSTMGSMNEAIYGYMQGPSEFTITGTLKSYDATPFLPGIRIPTLYTVGEFDEADTATVQGFAALTPGAQVAVLAGAAHITTWDAPEENVRVVREFLRRVDAVNR